MNAAKNLTPPPLPVSRRIATSVLDSAITLVAVLILYFIFSSYINKPLSLAAAHILFSFTYNGVFEAYTGAAYGLRMTSGKIYSMNGRPATGPNIFLRWACINIFTLLYPILFIPGVNVYFYTIPWLIYIAVNLIFFLARPDRRIPADLMFNTIIGHEIKEDNQLAIPPLNTSNNISIRSQSENEAATKDKQLSKAILAEKPVINPISRIPSNQLNTFYALASSEFETGPEGNGLWVRAQLESKIKSEDHFNLYISLRVKELSDSYLLEQSQKQKEELRLKREETDRIAEQQHVNLASKTLNDPQTANIFITFETDLHLLEQLLARPRQKQIFAKRFVLLSLSTIVVSLAAMILISKLAIDTQGLGSSITLLQGAFFDISLIYISYKAISTANKNKNDIEECKKRLAKIKPYIVKCSSFGSTTATNLLSQLKDISPPTA